MAKPGSSEVGELRRAEVGVRGRALLFRRRRRAGVTFRRAALRSAAGVACTSRGRGRLPLAGGLGGLPRGFARGIRRRAAGPSGPMPL